MKRFLICIGIFWVGILHTNAQIDYPNLTEFVTDQAGVMTSFERTSLQEKLIAYEDAKTHQIVVLTIKNLEGNTIENYALQVFNKNGVGQEEADNGILVLFSKDDREVRIEVGNGFEPIITDAFASRVIRNTMIPEFKKESYFEGINSGVDEIIKLIDDPRYRDEFAQAIEEDGQLPLWGKILLGLFMTAFLGVFIVVGGAVFLKSYRTLIDIYKGFITGKISLLTFPFLLLGTTLGILFSLPFIIMPLVFAYVIITSVMLEEASDPFTNIETLINNPNVVTYVIVFVLTLLVGIPLVVAFFSKKPYQELKLSLVKNDKKYMIQNISSSGSSWSSGSSSSSFSGGSSSSFSGGGGSSSGGGASGSW